jgi:hypothetical protein
MGGEKEGKQQFVHREIMNYSIKDEGKMSSSTLQPVIRFTQRPCITTVDARPLPSSAWAGWMCFDN